MTRTDLHWSSINLDTDGCYRTIHSLDCVLSVALGSQEGDSPLREPGILSAYATRTSK